MLISFKIFQGHIKCQVREVLQLFFSLDNVHLKTTLTVTFKEALVKMKGIQKKGIKLVKNSELLMHGKTRETS